MNPAVLSVFGVEPFRIGGNEAFARELSIQLGRHGWESILCFLSEPPEAVRRFLGLPNVTFETLPGVEGLALRPSVGLARLVRRRRPAILHLHFTGFVGPYPWLARLCGVEGVYFTDQSSWPEGFLPRRAPFWKRAAVRLINAPLKRVVSVSEYGRNCLTSFDLLPPHAIERVYNAVDFSIFGGTADGFRRKHGIPDGRPLVIQVSWIRPEKGIADLIETARRVIEQEPQVHFAVVGEGSWREEYQRRAEAAGLGGNITWTGLVENPFAEGLYAAADVVCQLSRWEEVFGWVIAEAMAAGKPLVATRVGGIPELVEHGETGFLVNRGDAAAAASSILTLLRDEELRETMGDAGRRRVAERFEVTKNVSRLVEIYGIS